MIGLARWMPISKWDNQLSGPGTRPRALGLVQQHCPEVLGCRCPQRSIAQQAAAEIRETKNIHAPEKN